MGKLFIVFSNILSCDENIGGNICSVLYKRLYNVCVKHEPKEYSHETF